MNNEVSGNCSFRATAAVLFLCLQIAPGCERHSQRAACRRMDGPFQAEGSIHEAFEGGPCIIGIRLSYQGTKNIDRCYPYSDPEMLAHPSWGNPREQKVWFREVGDPLTVRSGDAWLRTLFLHHKYPDIRPGRQRLSLIWRVYQAPTGKDPIPGFDEWCIPSRQIAAPSIDLDVDVLPATPGNLTALRQRLERQLDACATQGQLGALVRILTGVKHKELAPLAWRFIEEHREWMHDEDTFSLADAGNERAEEVDARFTRLAIDPSFVSWIRLFDYLAHRQRPVSTEALATLTKADSLRVRVLTYVSFPKQCPEGWVSALLADLRNLMKPVPAPQFSRLLMQLDDDTFDVREKAMADLARYGRRAEKQLRGSLDTLLPPEAAKRVRCLLEPLNKTDDPKEWEQVVDHLSWEPGIAARAVLEALMKGEPEAPLAKAAEHALRHHKYHLSQEP